MNTFELEKLLKPLRKNNHRPFKGVFALDLLPKTIHGAFSLVFNVDPSYKEGIHWQIVSGHGQTLEHFCSFGSEPLPEVIEFAKRCNYKRIVYSKVKIQGSTEITCGGYCVFVADQLCAGKSFTSILQHFDRTSEDDSFIKKYLLETHGFKFRYEYIK